MMTCLKLDLYLHAEALAVHFICTVSAKMLDDIRSLLSQSLRCSLPEETTSPHSDNYRPELLGTLLSTPLKGVRWRNLTERFQTAHLSKFAIQAFTKTNYVNIPLTLPHCESNLQPVYVLQIRNGLLSRRRVWYGFLLFFLKQRLWQAWHVTYLAETFFLSQNLDSLTLNHGKIRSICWNRNIQLNFVIDHLRRAEPSA